METNCRLVVVSFYRNMELIFDRPTLRASFATQNDNFKLISHRIQCGGDGVELRRVAQIKDARHFLGLAAHYACHICRPHAVLKLGIQERDLCGDGKRQRDKALRWPRPARRPGGLAVPGPGREFRSGRLCSACWGSRSGSNASWQAEQWGIFVVSIIYADAWARGLWVYWISPRRERGTGSIQLVPGRKP